MAVIGILPPPARGRGPALAGRGPMKATVNPTNTPCNTHISIHTVMKKITYILLTITLASCVHDLDTKPLNATDPISEYVYGTSEDAYTSGLARLYFQFVTNDLTDLQNSLRNPQGFPDHTLRTTALSRRIQ